MNQLDARFIAAWHLLGIVSGCAAVATAQLASQLLAPSSDLAQVTRATGVILFEFVLATPLLIALIAFWQLVARRYPTIEAKWTVKWPGLLLLALFAAVSILVALLVFTLYFTDAPEYGASLSRLVGSLKWKVAAFPDIYAQLYLACVAWAVLPRILVPRLSGLRSTARPSAHVTTSIPSEL